MRGTFLLAEIAGGVLLFPFIRLFAPFRHYAIGFVFLALFALQISQVLNPDNSIQTDDPRLADVVAYEDLLSQKAVQVLDRFGASNYSVDLSVVLDHTTVTTTTFDPGNNQHSTSQALKSLRAEDSRGASVDKDGGVWQEEVSNSPRIRNIKVYISVDKNSQLDQDQLFRSLSYALGIDLARGDVLRLVMR